MVKEEIKKLAEESIRELQKAQKLPLFDIPQIKIEYPEDKDHGDYSTDAAMVIAKSAKKSPLEIALLLAKELSKKNKKLFEKIEAKKGFVNFFLSDSSLIEDLKKILKEKDKYGSSREGKGKTIIIDYSAPNIAKSFGVGHLRSTIIGQAIYNIYKFLGWKTIGDNHLGDWGTQFGKLIVAVKKWGSKKDFSVKKLEELYVKFHKETESNPELIKKARQEFRNLEKNEKAAREIWRKCVQVSLKEFNRIYKLLGVKFDYVLSESFYEPFLKDVVREAIEKGVAKKSQGALVVEYPEGNLPSVVILKSDGATNYFTRDLATIKYRLKRWQPELIAYEVGAEQTLHFKQLFKAVELLGWSEKTRLFHVGHGLYRTKTGKFSTREGKTISLEEVIKEVINKARKFIEASGIDRGFSQKEKEAVARTVGIGVIKYNNLVQHYSKDIIFDWNKILNLKGNSAPYLQYTFTRCQSVLKKGKFKSGKKIKPLAFSREEKDFLREIRKFPEVVKEAGARFSPNLICNFLFNLSQKYNLFYSSHPIIKAETPELKAFRLALTASFVRVLKNGLELMGISIPKKM